MLVWSVRRCRSVLGCRPYCGRYLAVYLGCFGLIGWHLDVFLVVFGWFVLGLVGVVAVMLEIIMVI